MHKRMTVHIVFFEEIHFRVQKSCVCDFVACTGLYSVFQSMQQIGLMVIITDFTNLYLLNPTMLVLFNYEKKNQCSCFVKLAE